MHSGPRAGFTASVYSRHTQTKALLQLKCNPWRNYGLTQVVVKININTNFLKKLYKSVKEFQNWFSFLLSEPDSVRVRFTEREALTHMCIMSGNCIILYSKVVLRWLRVFVISLHSAEYRLCLLFICHIWIVLDLSFNPMLISWITMTSSDCKKHKYEEENQSFKSDWEEDFDSLLKVANPWALSAMHRSLITKQATWKVIMKQITIHFHLNTFLNQN